MTDEEGGIPETPEVPEAEPAAPEQAEVPQAPMADESPVLVTEPVNPAPKRTGLFIVVAAIVLILIACVFAGPVMFAAISKSTSSSSTSTASSSKAKITVTIDFVKALLNGDTLAIKGFLRDEAQKAITEAQWKELAAQDSTSAITYSEIKWSGDTTAVITLDAPDTGAGESTGTLTFRYDETEPLTVVMSAAIGETTEVDSIVLVQQGSTWRVVSISNGSQATTFDAALIKSMVDTSTATTTSSTTTP